MGEMRHIAENSFTTTCCCKFVKRNISLEKIGIFIDKLTGCQVLREKFEICRNVIGSCNTESLNHTVDNVKHNLLYQLLTTYYFKNCYNINRAPFQIITENFGKFSPLAAVSTDNPSLEKFVRVYSWRNFDF